MTNATQSMFFKSKGVDAHWDTWMFFHEDTYYLFYLITEYSPGEGFGLATSPDGVTWTDHGWAIKGIRQNGHLPRHRRRLEITRLRHQRAASSATTPNGASKTTAARPRTSSSPTARTS